MTEPRRIDGMSYAEYHSAPGIRSSDLKACLTSPLECWYRQRQPMADSPALRLGRASHTSALEPRRFLAEYALYDGRRAGKVWDAFRDDPQNTNKTILNRTEYDAAVAIGDAVQAHRIASTMLAGGAAEVSLFWDDEQTGLRCKARPDYLTTLTLPDLKTTRDPSPAAFGRTCVNFGYPLQLAHYLAGVRAVCGTDPAPYFVVVGSTQPHDVIVYRVPDDIIELGEADRVDMMQTMSQMRERFGDKRWPGVAPDGAMDLELPRWAYPDEPVDEMADLDWSGMKEAV